MKNLIIKAVRFLRETKFLDRINVVYHQDVDGLCSAFLTAKFLEKTSQAQIRTISSSIVKETVFRILEKIKGDTIFLDLNLDAIEGIKSHIQFPSLIIDHHNLSRDLNSRSCVHLNSWMISKKYYPTSKLAFDLYSRVTDLGELAWISAIGIIADQGGRYWKGFISKTCKEAGLRKRDLEKIARMMGSLISHGKTKLAFSALEKSPDEVLKDKRIERYHAKIENEVKRVMRSAKKRDRVVILELISKYRIRSIVATVLGRRFPSHTVIVLQQEPEYVTLGLRRDDGRADMVKFAEKLVSGIPGASFGGHRKAAGAKVKKEFYHLLKENIKKWT